MMYLILHPEDRTTECVRDLDGRGDGRTVIEVEAPLHVIHKKVDWDTLTLVDTDDFRLLALRAERDRRLAATDWTQLADVPEETRAAWAPYRQALRDMPLTADLTAPVWPEPPTSRR